MLHLYSLGRIGPDEVADVGFTQKGIARATGLRQSSLTNVLARLRATGALEVDRRHVSGEPRRINVYRLTALGEAVARDLRKRTRTSAPASLARPYPDEAGATRDLEEFEVVPIPRPGK